MVKKLLFLSSMLFVNAATANINSTELAVFASHQVVLMKPLTIYHASANTQVNCMVRTAIAEAENQSVNAKIGVMYTIRNRATQRRKSYCSIVNEPSQFSHRRIRGPQQYKEMYALAEGVISGRIKDTTNGATFFHDDSLKRNPFRKTVKTIKLDNMVFYRSTKVAKA
jgi:spore germination cell wall hydrolase CwlJ-like protein